MTAYQFFLKHAGYSYDPETETPIQGRRRCAKTLAAAEKHAQTHDWTYEWVEDVDADPLDWDGDGPMDTEAFGCILHSNEPQVGNRSDHLASLWSIWDPSPEYRRVVEAELALEAM